MWPLAGPGIRYSNIRGLAAFNLTTNVYLSVAVADAIFAAVAAATYGDGLVKPLPSPNIAAVDEALPSPPEELETEEQALVPQPTVKPARVPPRANKYACMECGQTFKLRPELVGHAKREHADKVAAILAPYPG